jgi:hypothetical protein
MFNDKYGLTEAVMQGRKTMTRRVIDCATLHWLQMQYGNNTLDWLRHVPYIPNLNVAVAQSYAKLNAQGLLLDDGKQTLANSKGWNNKMFVKADLMPHQIRIINARVEHLQDISNEDCLREGIKQISRGYVFDPMPNGVDDYHTPREAYAALIDKIGGKGTWKRNPYVFVYDFKLVK